MKDFLSHKNITPAHRGVIYSTIRDHYQKYGLKWWEEEADDGKVERWIFERSWLALEPKARGRHVVVGKNKRVVLKRIKYKDRVVSNTAANIIKWGCGALNIAACRIGADKVQINKLEKWSGFGQTAKPNYTPEQSRGRWPANALFSHSVFCEKVGEKRVRGSQGKRGASTQIYGGGKGFTKATGEEVGYTDPDGLETVEDWRCVKDCPVRMLDEQSGVLKSGRMVAGQKRSTGGGYHGNFSGAATEKDTYGDQGGASRFFYTAKPSGREKKAGLSAEHNLFIQREEKKSDHPTIKSITLMRYLCRLVTPPGGTVLDCFAGSGSTGCAAVLEGFQFVGTEKELEYVEIMRSRIEYWARQRVS